jgi:hypothetical protein
MSELTIPKKIIPVHCRLNRKRIEQLRKCKSVLFQPVCVAEPLHDLVQKDISPPSCSKSLSKAKSFNEAFKIASSIHFSEANCRSEYRIGK